MTRYNELGDLEAHCMHCGELFYFDERPGNKPMYCSRACRQKAYRERRRRRRQAGGQRPVDAAELRVRIAGDKVLLFVADRDEPLLVLRPEAAGILAARLNKAGKLLTARQLEL